MERQGDDDGEPVSDETVHHPRACPAARRELALHEQAGSGRHHLDQRERLACHAVDRERLRRDRAHVEGRRQDRHGTADGRAARACEREDCRNCREGRAAVWAARLQRRTGRSGHQRRVESIDTPDAGMAKGSAERRHGDQRRIRRRNCADRDTQFHEIQPHAAIATATAVASGCAAPCATTANLDRLDSRSLSLTRSPMSIRVAVIALTLLLQQLPPPFHSPWFRKPTRVVAMPETHQLTVPAGFAVNVFADKLQFARFMALAPNGDVFLAEPVRGAGEDHGPPRCGPRWRRRDARDVCERAQPAVRPRVLEELSLRRQQRFGGAVHATSPARPRPTARREKIVDLPPSDAALDQDTANRLKIDSTRRAATTTGRATSSSIRPARRCT